MSLTYEVCARITLTTFTNSETGGLEIPFSVPNLPSPRTHAATNPQDGLVSRRPNSTLYRSARAT